jgi:hypothetical protein
MEIDVLHQEDEPETYDPTADREAALGLIEEFAPEEARSYMDAFIEEVSGWKDVRMWAGRSQYPERRRVFFSRRGSQLGAFVWIMPRLANVRPRLDPSDMGPDSSATTLNVKHAYKLRLTLETDQDLKEAIEAARIAYDRAV